MPLMRFASPSASLNTKKERAAVKQPALSTGTANLPLCLSLTPVESYRLNRPFNDPGQAVKIGSNAPQVNIRCGGPLVTQKLLYVRVMLALCDLTRLTAK